MSSYSRLHHSVTLPSPGTGTKTIPQASVHSAQVTCENYNPVCLHTHTQWPCYASHWSIQVTWFRPGGKFRLQCLFWDLTWPAELVIQSNPRSIVRPNAASSGRDATFHIKLRSYHCMNGLSYIGHRTKKCNQIRVTLSNLFLFLSQGCLSQPVIQFKKLFFFMPHALPLATRQPHCDWTEP